MAINHYSASLFPDCADKMTIVYDWIDFSNRFEKRSYDEIFGEDTKQLKVLLFTGGMARIKGTLEVVQTFHENIQGSEYRLLMMGAGLDYKFSGISGKIKRLLMLTGWKPYGYRVSETVKSDNRIVCIPATYKIVDILRQCYLNISYFTIPHANLALAEATCLGTVSVAPRTEESLEYVGGEDGAVLYTINDKEDFVRAIDYAEKNYKSIKEKVQLKSLGIQQVFGAPENVERFNRVCKSIS